MKDFFLRRLELCFGTSSRCCLFCGCVVAGEPRKLSNDDACVITVEIASAGLRLRARASRLGNVMKPPKPGSSSRIIAPSREGWQWSWNGKQHEPSDRHSSAAGAEAAGQPVGVARTKHTQGERSRHQQKFTSSGEIASEGGRAVLAFLVGFCILHLQRGGSIKPQTGHRVFFKGCLC